MASSTAPGAPAPGAGATGRRDLLRALVLFGGSLATVPLLAATTLPLGAALIVPVAGLTVYLAHRFQGLARRRPAIVGALALLGAAVAMASIVTGRFNGLSDEPYSTPSYASLGLGLYQHPVSFDYVEYGRTLHETSFDVYLPALTFVQVPGIDYRWVSLGAWAAMLAALRSRPVAALGLAMGWVPLLAANGQNDFVPLLAVSLALALGPYRGRALVELAALSLKQFANVLVFGYHLLRREFRAAALAVVGTVVILLPFLLLDPGAVYCHVLVGDPGTTCHGRPWTFFVFKRNFWLYPTWVAVVFPAATADILRRAARWVRRSRSAPAGEAPVP